MEPTADLPAPPTDPTTAETAGRAITVTACTVARLGRTPEENEDSYAVGPETGRFAVADGASTSARPEVWSRLLVDAYVHHAVDPLAPDTLRALRERWWREVDRPGLPWFAQAKLQSGADSSFLGLRVDTAARLWAATCVGDSCLFHLRGRTVRSVGPVERSGEFARFAELVNSRPVPTPEPTTIAGTYRSGDMFVLATDAMAHFLLLANEMRGTLPSMVRFTRSPAQFERMVAAYRRQGFLGNDDTTLCVVYT